MRGRGVAEGKHGSISGDEMVEEVRKGNQDWREVGH